MAIFEIIRAIVIVGTQPYAAPMKDERIESNRAKVEIIRGVILELFGHSANPVSKASTSPKVVEVKNDIANI